MTALPWLRQVQRQLFGSRRSAARHRRLQNPPQARPSIRPHLEALEERLVPSTIAVGNEAQLEAAIVQANKDSNADTIVLQAGGAYNPTSQLTITTKYGLTLEGNGSSAAGTVIDAGGKSRVFLIEDGGTNIVFQNLTIQGGSAKSTPIGAGIWDTSGNVTLSSVVLQNNIAQAGYSGPAARGADALGGGIYVQGGSLTISNSVIRNNQALGGSGAPGGPGGDAVGGGVYFNNPYPPYGQLRITNSTVADNAAVGGLGVNSANSIDGGDGGGATGGGVYATEATIIASTLSGNRATGGNGSIGGPASGGAIYVSIHANTATITNSTVSGNSSVGGSGGSGGAASGGGVNLDPAGYGPGKGSGTLTNVTVVNNQANGPGGAQGGGISSGVSSSSGGSVVLVNSLIALNSAASGPDFYGAVSNSSHNLIGNASGSSGFNAAHGDLLGINPHLGPLANNGGPTQTIALLAGSPAIDAGDNNALSVTGSNDQRGSSFPRVVNGAIDIGAFEYQPPPPPAPPPGGGGSSSSGTTTGTSPSLFQALLSLFLDGAMSEAFASANTAAFFSGNGYNAQVAAAESLLNFLLSIHPLANEGDALHTDIAANLPYAGPFGPFVVMAGEQAAYQALPPSPPPNAGPTL